MHLLCIQLVDDVTVDSFNILNTISIWKEPEAMKCRITLASLLTYGMEFGIFSLREVNSGGCLELTFKWSTSLLDLSIMNRKRLTAVSSPY